MKNLKKSAVALCAVFASMQIAFAGQFDGVDVGLGKDLGGSQINHATDGLIDITGKGSGNVGLIFNDNTHINWEHLNVGDGESLNFSAQNPNSNLTILNTVNSGMTNVYGTINASSGIGQLIISNPNGVLFDGAHFTTAGDVMITTQDMSNLKLEDLNNAKFTQLWQDGKLIPIRINNSIFEVGGNYNIIAAGIDAANSTISADTVKLVTANGQDYLALKQPVPDTNDRTMSLKAVTINGDLYITNGAGAVEVSEGGTFNGNLNVNSKGDVVLNKDANGKKLTINGDADINGSGAQMYLRNADVIGNLNMKNGGGFLDVGNIHVTKNATLTTTNETSNNVGGKPIKHFVHVIGETQVDGDLTVESENNIHIGGYDYDAKKLADGKLTVGGDLTAHAKDGHIMTTIDTSANKISLTSDNLNVLTDGKATLTANEYQFSANGYIGGMGSTANKTVDEVIIDTMEGYKHIPNQTAVENAGTLNIAGGNITALNAPTDANILSKGDVKLTGANAGNVNITAPGKYIEITGENVKADNINVGRETDKLKVDYPSRNYNLNYTNIRDNEKVTIKGGEEITYELTNGENGYNQGTQIKGENTYLVGPEGPDDPGPGPDDPTPDPGPDPIPDPNENIKVLKSFENQSVNMNQVYTPVAYAADLDEDKVDTGVRKNVDGSVTVVRAFPMVN